METTTGSIGDAYLFATTKDSALLRFHAAQRSFYNGNWVDDRAWAGTRTVLLGKGGVVITTP